MPFERCPKCQHRKHKGEVCQYPKSLFSTPGVPVERCSCIFRVRIERVFKGRSFKTSTRRGLVNSKVCSE